MTSTAPEVQGFPLSLVQARRWQEVQRAALGTGVYAAIRVTGPVDVERLRGAVAAVVARHEILRTGFQRLPQLSLPLQVIREPEEAAVEWPPGDEATAPSWGERWSEFLAECDVTAAGASMDEAPPLRLRWTRLAGGEHLLLLALSPLCADGDSLGVLLRDLVLAYGDPTAGDEAPMQYADFAAWQNELAESDEVRADEAFWRRAELTELLATQELPFAQESRGTSSAQESRGTSSAQESRGTSSDQGSRGTSSDQESRGTSSDQESRGTSFDQDSSGTSFNQESRGTSEEPSRSATVALPADPAAAAVLEQLAAGVPAPLESVVVAACAACLARLVGQPRVALEVLASGRGFAELADAVGPFSRFLPLALAVDDGRPFADLVRAADREVTAGRERQDAFRRDWLAPAGSAPPTPGWAVEWWEPPAARLRAGVGFELAARRVVDEAAALRFSFSRRPDGLELTVAYDPRRFAAQDVARLAHGALAFLRHARLTAPLADVDALGPEERRQALVEANATAAVLPGGELSLPRLVRDRTMQVPEAVAVASGTEQVSYAELQARVDRLAARLSAAGLAPGGRVVVGVERSSAMVLGILAAVRCGAAWVPLDPEHPDERLGGLLVDVAPSLILTRRTSRDRFLAAGATVPVLAVEEVLTARDSVSEPWPEVSPASLAYVIFTSGSTGRPKGVMVPHRAIVNRLLWMQAAHPWTADDAFLQKTPATFDASIWELFSPLLVGARLVLAGPEGHRDSHEQVTAVLRERITVLQLVPSLLGPFLSALGERRLPGLRRLFCGGEELTRELVARFRQRSSAAVVNLYGPTEAAIDATSWPVPELPFAELPARLPIGRPLVNVEVHLATPRLRLLGFAAPGELLIGGRGLAWGYLRRPGLTAERFIPDPWSGRPGARLYRSGDLARRWRGDEVEYLGRIDRQVKIRGVRIEPREIERLLSADPRVAAAVVRPVGAGNEERRLLAYVVPAAGAAPSSDELRALLARQLPTYMVPGAFISLPAFPLTASGKLDWQALPEAPPAERAAVRRAPRNAVEQQLLTVLEEVLGLRGLGIDDNFFQLGGDSILSLQVIGRAARHGLRLTARQIFEHPTVAALAPLAATAAATPGPRAEQGLVSGTAPLTPVQHAFFAFRHTETHHYNQAVFLEIRRRLAPGQWAKVADALERHHDALRLRYRRTDEGWEQEHAAPDGRLLVLCDLSALPADRHRAALERTAAALHRGFDLAAGPLARLALCRLGEAEPDRLLFALHHLVVDGVSLRVLLEDLAQACSQSLAGEAVTLPAKTTSFKEWAERLQRYAGSETLRAELAHWLTYWLAPRRRHAAPLPLDDDPGDNTVADADTVTVELAAEATQALLREVHTAYRTEIGDVLLAALGLALARWRGAGPVLLDLEGHGREPLFDDVDLSRTVGWLTSVFPLLLELDAATGPREALITAKETLRNVPLRGIGYGVLRYLCPDAEVRRQLATLPQAELVFNYLGQLDVGGGDEGAGNGRVFAPAREAGGTTDGRRGERRYLIDVNALVAGGRLRVEWRYNRRAHRRSTVEGLADSFRDELLALIEHCRSPGAGGYTPSDFPLARLDRARLDELAARHGELEDVYPLSPMQEAMLLHTLSFPDSQVGFEQTVVVLRGAHDPATLCRAWERAIERHPILRTCFAWGEPAADGEARAVDAVQVVVPRLALPWEEVDARDLPPAEQAARRVGALAGDRRRGFDMAQAPLWRLTLLRLADDRAQLIWSCHHALLDGWSTAQLLSEVDALYGALRRNAEPELPPARPYRDYIAWLVGQDPAPTERYWREQLAGFAGPTAFGVDRDAAPAGGEAAHAGVQRRLPAARTAALRVWAGAAQLTLGDVLQGAWAALLGRYSGHGDVLFGVTVAGRPAELDGVEAIAGLFIKNLPLRLRWTPGEPASRLLAQVQARQLELREHEARSPADVQPWSEVPGHLPLFESLVVYENYPIDAALLDWDAAEAEKDSSAAVRTAYPLTLAAAEARELVLLLVYDTARFEATAAARAVHHLDNLLAALAEAPERAVEELSLLTSGERQQLLWEWSDAAGGGSPGEVILAPASLDLESGYQQPVPIGVAGELCRMRPGAPLQRTGEGARYAADGRREELGPLAEQLWIEGRRCSPRRLEEALAAHPGVAAAAVAAHALDGALPRLVAYIVVAGPPPAAAEVREHLRRHLPGAPTPAEIVVLDALPRTAAGDFDRAALPAPATARLAARVESDLLGRPQDLVETQLTRLWEEVLGTRPIAPDDGFFALGGTSVAALRLASRVRDSFGCDLPLALLFQGATVRALAAHLRARAGADPWAPLVAIRPGGDKAPFFCVHPVGGNVLCFVDLASRMDADRPFYALQAVGLGGEERPLTRLAEMAARYLAEIRQVQPQGPYRLGGLSFGGYVAFEMACQLRRQGEEVALVALLDTGSPVYGGKSTFWADAETVVATQAGYMAHRSPAELGIAIDALRPLDREAQLHSVVERLLASGAVPPDLGEEHLRRVLALYQAHALCLESFAPQPYPGALTLFRAAESHAELDALIAHPARDQPEYGWGELAAEPVRVRRVPGSHSTMIYEPHAATLARELDAALAESEAGDGGARGGL